MWKTIILVGLILLFYYTMSNYIVNNDIKIPDEAIRIRIVAHSNNEYDQNIKGKVKSSVQLLLNNELKDVKTIEMAREKVINSVNLVKKDVNNVLKLNNYNRNYNVNYGYNYFPKKEYKGVKYDEGYYESLLITLGDGLGDNWWCLLFPPLCLLEAEESTEVEYKSYIKEVLDKYF